MKISIILPFRNAATWIEETIISIQKQTHEDWELLAINDHSVDETQEIIQGFSDSRIRLTQNSGKGIIPALQTGLFAAEGVYVSRMDADDLMPENKLKILLEHAKIDRFVVTGKVQYFSETEVSEGYRKYESWLNDRIDQKDHFDHIYRECVVASPNWLVPAEYLRKDRIFDQLNYPEDYDMTFLWRKYGYQIETVNTTTHLWREHPSRTSRNSEVYDQPSFFQLKLDWFRRSEKGKTLGVFGVGQKGKLIVDELRNDFEIQWFDHEFERYGAGINGWKIEDPEGCRTDLLLLAIYPQSKTRLENFVTRLGYTFGKNVWYV